MAEYYIAPKTSFDATADAIREKTGSQATIEWTQDGFADAIDAIPSGDTSIEPPEKAVNFIDYDGTRLYSYSAEEFLALTELPPNPTHEGLTSQGWNWTLADAKEQVEYCGYVDIGEMYIPSDGKTHIGIIIPQARRQFILRLGQTVANTVQVDWGDGTVETISGTSVAEYSHTYASGGSYEIKIDAGNAVLVFNGNTSTNMFGSISSANGHAISGYVDYVYFGRGVESLHGWTLFAVTSVREVIVPNGAYAPAGGNSIFEAASALKAVVLPKSFTQLPTQTFKQNYSMRYVSIPKEVTSLGSTVFGQHYVWSHITLPKWITSVGAQLYYRNQSLITATVPEGISSLGDSVWYQCYAIKEIHMKRTTPPSISNSNAWTSIPSDLVIYVPYSEDHSVLDAYKNATNWSVQASKMQEEPQS